jgi:transglutaminase-like putative cysteine protease
MTAASPTRTGSDLTWPGRLVLAGLAGLAAVPFGVLLIGHGYLVVTGAAVAAVTGVSWALSPRRPLAVTVTAAAAALVAVAAAGLALTGHEPAGLVDALLQLPSRWPELARGPVRAAATPETVVVPVAGAAVAAFAGHELASRSRRPVLGTLPPGALLVLGLVYAGRNGSGSAAVLAAVAGYAAGVLVVAATDQPHPGSRFRPAAVVIALVAVGAGVAVGTRAPVPPGDRFELRDHLSAEAGARLKAMPLAQAADSLAEADDPVVFRITLSTAGGAPDTPLPPAMADRVRLRVATLDRYDDGEAWGPARPLVPVGDLLPHHYSVADTPGVLQDVTLTDAYAGPFVPSLGTPVGLLAGREGLLFDGVAGDLALAPASAHRHYQVVSPARPGTVPDAPTGDDLAALTRLPGPVPVELQREVEGLPAAPRPRMEALAARMRDGSAGYDPHAAAGQSYPRLVQFVSATAQSGEGAAGTIEQPTAAMAVLARLAGLPARVVVGYDVPLPPPVPGTGARTMAVTAHQVRAWVEVHLTGEGWIPIEVTPRAVRPPGTQDPAATTTTAPLPAGRAPAAATTVAPSPAPDPGPCGAPAGGGAAGCVPAGSGPAVPWAALGLVVVAGALVGLPAFRWLRRWRRRRRRAPADRIFGAWQETAGALRRRGLAVPRWATTAELVVSSRKVLGDDVAVALTRWSGLLDAAVYGASEPDGDLADAAWNAHHALTVALRSSGSPVERARSVVDPRR